MAKVTVKGKEYLLPTRLKQFQEEMYVHLIEWKWKNITKAPGQYGGIDYDAILPMSYHAKLPHIYPGIVSEFDAHNKKFPIKLHTHFYHMASSQAANINLFLPILISPNVDKILGKVKPDFKKLAKKELYNGYCIEYWDRTKPKGLLNDHTSGAGTDSDIAIAYYNKSDELCLWLIEHKLTEPEFTTCGGFKSNGKDRSTHNCEKTFTEILNNKNLCYYHEANRCKYKYWDITDDNKEFFVNHKEFESCPFKKGMNQLWRNQIMGFAIEKDANQPFNHVDFSVVKHPGNNALDKTIEKYKTLIDNNPKFSVITSKEIVDLAEKSGDKAIKTWVDWYRKLYMI